MMGGEKGITCIDAELSTLTYGMPMKDSKANA